MGHKWELGQWKNLGFGVFFGLHISHAAPAESQGQGMLRNDQEESSGQG